jgi:RNA 3'-phosphate cyclase
MIHIDGAQEEGGGQIMRTALSLSALLGLPVTIENIRANRPKAGLRPQHLTAVKALKEICNAEVEGMSVDSRRIAFRPERVRPGDYFFDVGTAGSVTLILQALLLPLARATSPSRIKLKGGTHVPWSPPYHYLAEVFLPTLALMGIKTAVRLEKWGWYPKGGGEVEMDILPAEVLTPLVLDQPWEPDRLNILCASSNLPDHILERERKRIEARLQPHGFKAHYEIQQGASIGQGNMVFIAARKGQAAAGFSSLGARGKPAEQVAEEAVNSFLSFLDSGAAVDEHLGDQILPYLAVGPGTSRILVQGISSHLRTNLWVVNQFLPERLTLKDNQRLGKVTTRSLSLDGRGGLRREPFGFELSALSLSKRLRAKLLSRTLGGG